MQKYENICMRVTSIIIIIFLIYFFGHTACGILLPQSGDEPVPSAVEVQS